MGTAKVSVAYLRGQSSPTGQAHGSDKSPVFMGGAAVRMQLSWLWLRMTRQLLQGVLEHDELPHRRGVCGSAAKDYITTLLEHSSGWYREQIWAGLTVNNSIFDSVPFININILCAVT